MQPKKIVLTRFPFTDLSSTKRRPALILSKRKNNTQKDVIVAFISSVVPPDLSETDYLLTVNHVDFAATGLQKDSIFRMNKLATLDTDIFLGELGEISDNLFNDLKIKLKIVFDL